LNTTAINAYELFQGALLHSKKEESIRKVEILLDSFRTLNFTGPTSWIATEIYAQLRKKGAMIDLEDICIAAIAKLNDEMIVTRNIKHFSGIKDLKIQKW